jgi:hypothetical protein
MGSTVPRIDAGARKRLAARFGSEVEAWLDELPGVLTALAERWQFRLGSPIPRGSVSTVFHCRMADGRNAVLKASPDHARLAFEAAALDAWHTVHTPAVIALDEQLGALLIEAIKPGTPLVVSSIYPAAESVADLVSSLHGSGIPDPSYPTVGQRVAYLFDSSAKLYARHPELGAVFGGQLGGPMAMLSPLIGEMLGMESAPIGKFGTCRRNGARNGYRRGRSVRLAWPTRSGYPRILGVSP